MALSEGRRDELLAVMRQAGVGDIGLVAEPMEAK